ncbi:hypothetical protein FisN_19Lh160 [Fistulifera solaris]|uniref:Uncharacterized protein n=1 Tax=Fistulifera solaris TaxID=1519565 RepID=A0A1Z5J6S4_FISSO|nr:hypothetical protein FisN_19Lh160 [Fistulifera solaris]|eukprot:GAX09693.1 hypothetical protein FisN_19Lh160 [Fistulifera solaris]
MKVTPFHVALLSGSSVTSFVLHNNPVAPTTLSASRRDFITTASSLLVVGGVVMHPPVPANAELDFDRVQDLLKDTPAGAEIYKPAPKRPTYLAEPTEEFRQNEKKASDFKREQLKVKGQFTALLQKLQDDPNDETTLANDLDELRRLVRKGGGLPLGITKDEVVKQVRRRKARKFWPVNVEIAYQDLLAEIAYQQSPNTDPGSAMGGKTFI